MRLLATSRACLGDLAKLGHQLIKCGRGCPAGTSGQPESGTH